MGAHPRGTGSNPVQGNGHFFPHAVSSIFRLSLTHTHIRHSSGTFFIVTHICRHRHRRRHRQTDRQTHTHTHAHTHTHTHTHTHARTHARTHAHTHTHTCTPLMHTCKTTDTGTTKQHSPDKHAFAFPPLMCPVCITSWYPKFNGSHFGLPPSSIHRMTGQSGKKM